MSQSSPILGAYYRNGLFPYDSDSCDLDSEVADKGGEKIAIGESEQRRLDNTESSPCLTSPSSSPIMPSVVGEKRSFVGDVSKPRAIRMRPRVAALQVFEERSEPPCQVALPYRAAGPLTEAAASRGEEQQASASVALFENQDTVPEAVSVDSQATVADSQQ